MDPQTFQPDDPHLDELLDHALAVPPMRASLVDDIVAATTPMLSSRSARLLDLALAPDEPSSRLADRIIRATAPALYRKRHPVLAIFGHTPAYRIAAGILLAAMLGIWATMASIAVDARNRVQIESQLASLSSLAASGDAVDQEIRQLDQQLYSIQISTAWDADQLVDEDDARWPVDGPVSDMPWLF